MEKEVFEFVCDNCGSEQETKNSILPMHWVEVHFKTHYGTMEVIDLCDDCRDAFAKALMERRTK